MVPRQRLLLAALCLTACPAEQLGVELPKGGVEAISPEDLRRDAGDLEAAPDRAAAAELLGRRLGQMHLLPAFGSAWIQAGATGPMVCGRKEGKASGAILVLARGAPEEVDGAVAWAGLVSLAKAWDRPGRPERTLLLCAVAEESDLDALALRPPQPLDGVDAAWVLGSLHGSLAPDGARGFGPLTATTLSTQAPLPATVGAVDHRVVAGQLQAVFPRLAGSGG